MVVVDQGPDLLNTLILANAERASVAKQHKGEKSMHLADWHRKAMTSVHHLIVPVFLIALAVRFAASMPLSQLHTDEIGQYLEQAHRLVFGYGIVPWEYREGMRSWLVPLLIAPPMALGSAVAPDTTAYIVLPRMMMAVCSLSILWAGWRLGRSISVMHGLVAATVAATWFEFVYMGTRTLTEPLAVAAILPAAAILLDKDSGRRQVMLAGALFSLGCILRFHYGPTIGLIVLLGVWRHWERLGPLIAGGIAVAGVSAAVDLWAGQIPFEWVVTNFRFNIVHDVASRFGVFPPLAYVGDYIIQWGWAGPLIILCILPAIQHHRALFWLAILNLILHSLIGHKEYRFIFLTSTIFILLAAIGSVEIARWIKERYRPQASGLILLAPIPFWIITSAALAATPPRAQRWTQLNASMALTHRAGQLPDTCGFAFAVKEFWTSGSYSALHRNVPFYLEPGIDPAPGRASNRLEASKAYNSLVGSETLKSRLSPTYQIVECRATGMEATLPAYAKRARICLFHRPGPCQAKGAEQWQAQKMIESFGL